MTTLSVVLTNYNHALYLDRSITAIASQSRRPDEFIIIDDASTDNSLEIIERYALIYPFIKVVKNEKNLGVVLSQQKAIALASMGCLYCAAADDCVLPGFFELAIQGFDKYPDIGLCCGDIRIHNVSQEAVRTIRLGFAQEASFLSGDQLAECMAGQPIFSHSSIFNRQKFLDIGGFLESLSYLSDWFAALVLAFRHGIAYMPTPFCQATTGVSGSFAEDACKSWEVRHPVIASLLRLLKTQYRDVLPRFIMSSALTNYHKEVTKTVLTDPEFYDVESLLLAQYPLLVHGYSVAEATRRRATLS